MFVFGFLPSTIFDFEKISKGVGLLFDNGLFPMLK